jgi:hypothetical protein
MSDKQALEICAGETRANFGSLIERLTASPAGGRRWARKKG